MTKPTVAVIIPAYNASATLPACLQAIGKMTWTPDEVILFSDGATDDTDDIARRAGVSIIRNDGPPKGPAYGRNAAAQAAKSDLLLFVDADVVISPTALELLVDDMLQHGAKAAFGSYDDAPDSQRVTSLYANLRHHFVHQHSLREAKTFWSGLVVFDRGVFLAAGGFDAALFAYPSIEDIELGMRVVAAGHKIRLVPEALAKHWKDWSLWRVWHTDVVRRAYPWACLLAEGRPTAGDLNISNTERFKAVVAGIIPLCLLLAIAIPKLLIGAGIAALLYIWLNREFFGFLKRRLSFRRLLAAMAMHWCYHIYSTATFVFATVQTKLGMRLAVFR